MTIIFNISHFSTAPQLPAAYGADLRTASHVRRGYGCPLCRRASGRWGGAIVRASGSLSRPGRGGQGGGAGVYCGAFRLQASADVRRSESYYRLVTEVTTVLRRLPSGQALGAAA